MPTMTTPQEIAAAIDSALEAGGHLVIRFGHGQMRQLKMEEVELLVATLKGSAVPEGGARARTFTEAANLLLAMRDDTVMSKYVSQAECRAARDALWSASQALQAVASRIGSDVQAAMRDEHTPQKEQG
jgi:hypothetical protein